MKWYNKLVKNENKVIVLNGILEKLAVKLS